MEEESIVLSYSLVHDEFWPEMTEFLLEINEELPLFRYANNQEIINADRILQVLTERENALEENGFQTVVSAVINLRSRWFLSRSKKLFKNDF